MSLINDALKRARENQRNAPPPGPRPLPPVEAPARGGAGWILAAAAILFLAAACLVLAPSWFEPKAPPSMDAKTPAMSTPPPLEAAPAPSPLPPPAEIRPATNALPLPLPATNTITNPSPAAVAVESWPKLQGIIFNAARPLAIVNGQTVSVGDRVGDFQVKQIRRTASFSKARTARGKHWTSANKSANHPRAPAGKNSCQARVRPGRAVSRFPGADVWPGEIRRGVGLLVLFRQNTGWRVAGLGDAPAGF